MTACSPTFSFLRSHSFVIRVVSTVTELYACINSRLESLLFSAQYPSMCQKTTNNTIAVGEAVGLTSNMSVLYVLYELTRYLVVSGASLAWPTDVLVFVLP